MGFFKPLSEIVFDDASTTICTLNMLENTFEKTATCGEPGESVVEDLFCNLSIERNEVEGTHIIFRDFALFPRPEF